MNTSRRKLTFAKGLFLFLGIEFCTIVIFILLILYTPILTDSVILAQETLEGETAVKNYSIYRVDKKVDLAIEEMSTEEKIGQLFMLSFPGYSINDQNKSLVQEYYVGSLVLMSGNISYQNQTSTLVSELKSLSEIPLLITTDQEGGTVARIPWDEARYISAPHVGLVNRKDFAYEVGKQHADALNNLGIDMNLAPVLDIAFQNNSAMVSRSYRNDPQSVAELGSAFIESHYDTEVMSCAKHFPGIGRTSTDTHNQLATINISKDQLMSEELIPFISAIDQGVDAIMVGHSQYPQIDPDNPTSLSPTFITNILREELGFDGVVIIDDIHMGAMNNYPNKVIDSINAGADMIIIVDSYQNQVNYINQLADAVETGEVSSERVEVSARRILRLKYEYE